MSWSDSLPPVSVIMPCRNEARHITACLDSILAGDYPADRLEVLVADGRSDDGTAALLEAYAAAHPAVRVLDNPQRTTPAGLNAAIGAASGEVVLRMDAHVVYPGDYIRRLVRALEETGADNVGGVIRTSPADGSAVARAIAVGLSHPFGVGNSWFRIGSAHRRWVDTVPFGCWRREVFERIGLFDEQLVRNQDDELNFRLSRAGGRILLLPEVVSEYFARGSLRMLARMYGQYGWFKPLVARKLGRVTTLRQLVPPAFVAGTLLLALAGTAWSPARAALAALLVVYAAATAVCAVQAGRRHGPRCVLALLAVFPVIHFSYGIGFLGGLAEEARSRRADRARPGADAVALSR